MRQQFPEQKQSGLQQKIWFTVSSTELRSMLKVERSTDMLIVSLNFNETNFLFILDFVLKFYQMLFRLIPWYRD
jgi:hypothetical protein